MSVFRALKRPVAQSSKSPRSTQLDSESRSWLDALAQEGFARDRAIASLHDLLVRATRFEVNRRRQSLAHLASSELDDLVQQSADDALMAVLAKLDSFRGDSRFTPWAYKFAVLEASVKVRQRVWQNRMVPTDSAGIDVLADVSQKPETSAEHAELLLAIKQAISDSLSPHQRRVLIALTLNDVPIDVLAQRLGTTRGALYKTLHDGRVKLRQKLAERGFQTEVDSR
jgi:RNA polymerase sigma-70 factor, ECF subfamily